MSVDSVIAGKATTAAPDCAAAPIRVNASLTAAPARSERESRLKRLPHSLALSAPSLHRALTPTATRLDPRRAVGARGEQLACEHLERLGFAILARNVRTREGEIDVVAADARTLVFVEVKTLARDTRSSRSRAIGPLDGLRFAQRHRIRRLASAWLASGPRVRAQEIRFDAIGVTVDRTGALLALEHIEAAW